MITGYFFDSLMLEARFLDSDIPSTRMELFGETFDTPIMTAALSHLRVPNGNGLVIYAQAAAACLFRSSHFPNSPAIISRVTAWLLQIKAASHQGVLTKAS